MLSRPLTVMTRNVYVGADITEPLRAAADLSGPAALDSLGNAGHAVLQTALATDFSVRGRLLAAEIAAAAPDLVGLQEVAVWRRGRLDLTRLGAPSAEEVVWDFLDILRNELATCGAQYGVGHVFVGADVEAPTFQGSVQDATATGVNIRLTMHDVILVRADAGIDIRERAAAPFDRHLVATVAGVPLAFAHGYVRLDVERGPDRLRFVSTHLDSESTEISLAQAGELLAATADTDGTVVVVGDFNSDPDDEVTSAAYDFVRTRGFVDAAASVGTRDATWGFSPTLSDVDSSGFSRRIDFVFSRGRGISPVASTRTGIHAADRDRASGLWPSDHAGVVATFH